MKCFCRKPSHSYSDGLMPSSLGAVLAACTFQTILFISCLKKDWKRIYDMHFDGFALKRRNICMPYLIKNLPVSNSELGKFKHYLKANYTKSTYRWVKSRPVACKINKNIH